MMSALFLKEIRYGLMSLYTPLLLIVTTVLTYLNGSEFAQRNALSPGAIQLGLSKIGQEWAHRTSFAASGFPLLIVAVAVWHCASRSDRYGVKEIIHMRPITTGRLVLLRLVGLTSSMVIPLITGLILGVVFTGWRAGLWPDLSLFLQSTLMNLAPGLTASLVVIATLSSLFLDLKTLVFPAAISWLVLTNLPATSLFWMYREIANPLSPITDWAVWWRLIYCFLTALIATICLWVVIKNQREGKSLLPQGSVRIKGFRVAPQAFWGRIRFHLRITLGWRLFIALLGACGLALILASPFGLLKASPPNTQRYFALAFSELLFPLFGLLVSVSVLAKDHNSRVAQLICQRPGGEGKLLEQKVVGLVTYFISICGVYSLLLHYFLPSLQFGYVFGVLFPSMLFLSGLAMIVPAFARGQAFSYVVSLGYWFLAFYLEEGFPWAISPFYHLSEYTFKLGRDLLWQNKIILLVIACALILVGLVKTFKDPVRDYG